MLFWQCVYGHFASCPLQRKFRTNCTRSWMRFWVQIQLPWTRSLSSGKSCGSGFLFNPSNLRLHTWHWSSVSETWKDNACFHCDLPVWDLIIQGQNFIQALLMCSMTLILSHYCLWKDTASRCSTRRWGLPSWPPLLPSFSKWRAKSINTSFLKRYLVSCCLSVYFT